MGCDIHIYLENKKTVEGKEKWVSADVYKKNRYYDEDDKYEKEFEFVEIYQDRDYSLFSLLADVRNYSKNEPISKPRGIPSDCCKEIMEEYERWGEDGHSHSYYTLKELLEYQSKQVPVKYSGLVDDEGVKEIEKGNMPKYWCQWSSNEKLTYKEWEFKEDKLKPIIDKIYDRLKELWFYYTDEDITKDAEKIRIVFWFDN